MIISIKNLKPSYFSTVIFFKIEPAIVSNFILKTTGHFICQPARQHQLLIFGPAYKHIK